MRRVAAVTLLALVWGCAGKAPSGPPDIRLGVDVCDGCGMTISELRYAAAVAGEVEGEPRVLKFDDIGCLARWEARTSGFTPRNRWVHDRVSESWIEAGAARFVRSSAWATPMGSGLAAFSSPDDAGDGGEPMSWERVLDLARRGDLDAAVPSTRGEEPR